MRCLTNLEQKEWLFQQNIIEFPYHNENSIKHWVQFYNPTQFSIIAAYIYTFIDLFWEKDAALLSMYDWAPYEPHEIGLIEGIRLIMKRKDN